MDTLDGSKHTQMEPSKQSTPSPARLEISSLMTYSHSRTRSLLPEFASLPLRFPFPFQAKLAATLTLSSPFRAPSIVLSLMPSLQLGFIDRISCFTKLNSHCSTSLTFGLLTAPVSASASSRSRSAACQSPHRTTAPRILPERASPTPH